MKVTFRRTSNQIDGFWIEQSSSERDAWKKDAAPRGALGSALRVEETIMTDRWSTTETATGAEPTPDNQFFALYLDPASTSLVIPISSKMTPRIAGGDPRPDVEMRVELAALHLPQKGIQSGTVRIQVSQDGRFLNGRDALHWVVAAGLDLYQVAKDGKGKQKLKPGDLNADLAKPFIGRPISLPGGAGYLKIDVLQDAKKSVLENIWSSIVSLFRTPQGMLLAATVGFPAIGLPTVAFVDQLIQKYRESSDTNTVIEGKEMRWAFSVKALEKLKLGAGAMVEYPVMNEGYYVLIPAGRLSAVMATQPKYVAGYGYLVPGSVEIADQAAMAKYLDDVAKGDYPYRDLSYAVIGVEMRDTAKSDAW